MDNYNNDQNNNINNDNMELPKLKDNTEDNTNQAETLNPNINELDNPYFKVVDESTPIKPIEKTISPKTKKIITYILGALVLILFIYNIFIIYIKPDTKNLKNYGTESVLSDDSLTILLRYVPIINNTMSYPGAYRNSVVTINSVDMNVILNESLLELKNNSNDVSAQDSEAFNTFKTNNCTDLDNCYSFTKDTLANAVKKIYGSSTNIIDKDFTIGASVTNFCQFNNDLYMCKESKEQEAISMGIIREPLKGVETSNDEVYIYEKALFVVGAVTNTSTNTVTIDKIYKYNSTETLLDSNVSFTSTSLDYSKTLIDKYGDYVQVFKHTFKKNTDTNEYYWYSTTPVSGVE